MISVERPASDFRSLCTVLGYRKKKVRVLARESVTLTGLNWDSGSKNTYHSCEIKSGVVKTHSNFGNPHPWFNEREGARVAIPPGMIVIRTGVFLGKESVMEIYVHPTNMPMLLEKA